MCEVIDIAMAAPTASLPFLGPVGFLIRRNIIDVTLRWYRDTPQAIRDAAGVIDVPFRSYLICVFDLLKPQSESQFIYGFPTVGPLRRNKVPRPESITPAEQ